MKIAVISDIHSNYAALEATLEFLSTEGIDQIICLGDIVGYGPRPNECIDAVRENCAVTLMGNHDHAVVGKTSTYHFNEYAKNVVNWTREQLNPENCDFLENLPFYHSENDILFVHATPANYENWNYILSEMDAGRHFKQFTEKICFIGHSHSPVLFTENAGKIFADSIQLKLKEDRYIINVGSLGQPRDGNPNSCLVIYDTEAAQLTYHRIKYDVQKTYQEIIAADLPQFLAMRLLAGH